MSYIKKYCRTYCAEQELSARRRYEALVSLLQRFDPERGNVQAFMQKVEAYTCLAYAHALPLSLSLCVRYVCVSVHVYVILCVCVCVYIYI